MAAARSAAALEIRKLRKKLRQIENLERKTRELTDEEILKITKKSVVRDQLLRLLADFHEEEEEESYTASTKSETSFSQSNDVFSSSVKTDISDSIGDFDASAIEVTVISQDGDTGDVVDIEEIDSIELSEDISQNYNSERKGNNSHEKVAESKDNFVRNTVQDSKLKQGDSKKSESTSSPVKKTKTDKSSPVKSEKSSTLKSVVQKWRNSKFDVVQLEGHSDLITAVDSDGKILVSASRDTTVKVWDLETLSETRNLGGHTSNVTAVLLLSEEQSNVVRNLVSCDDGGRIILSGSTDCSFKIWSSNSGQVLRSTYTYNPVTKLVYHPVAQAVITGSDGGKVDMWDIETGDNLQSLLAHEEGITGLQVSDDLLYTSSADGILKVYDIRDKSLVCLFVSENVQSDNQGVITQRHIRGLAVNKTNIFYGDDGVNVKVLNWKTGVVHKLMNHVEDFGITDCFCCHGNIIISSAYNLDTGLGYLNVRYLPEENYITSVSDDDTERIVSVSCSEIINGRIAIVTAGLQLKIWLMCAEDRNSSCNNEELISAKYITKLAKKAEDSDVESDMEFTDSDIDMDIDEKNLQRRGSSSSKKAQTNSWLSWCNLL